MTTNSSISVKAFRAARVSRAEVPHIEFERPLLFVFTFYSPSLSSRWELDEFVSESSDVNGDGRRSRNNPAAYEGPIAPLLRVSLQYSDPGPRETASCCLHRRCTTCQWIRSGLKRGSA